jgi:hypothetical protein
VHAGDDTLIYNLKSLPIRMAVWAPIVLLTLWITN